MSIFTSGENPAKESVQPRVLRRLENIVCYSAVRMRRMTQYTASGMRLRQLLCLQLFSARARRRKQLSAVSYSLTRRFDHNLVLFLEKLFFYLEKNIS